MIEARLSLLALGLGIVTAATSIWLLAIGDGAHGAITLMTAALWIYVSGLPRRKQP